MAISGELEAYVIERLEAAGFEVRSRRMFGGVGIYLDETFCALMAPDDGGLYFKTDDSNRADYERAGAKPFKPFEGRTTVMSYYRVPEEVIEDGDALQGWARKARAAALAAPRKRRGGA
ncbi:MAG TPA: TfoX/Sxy family protein [Gammaproteobacteria bacterium]